jgi:hypothetical protein
MRWGSSWGIGYVCICTFSRSGVVARYGGWRGTSIGHRAEGTPEHKSLILVRFTSNDSWAACATTRPAKTAAGVPIR